MKLVTSQVGYPVLHSEVALQEKLNLTAVVVKVF